MPVLRPCRVGNLKRHPARHSTNRETLRHRTALMGGPSFQKGLQNRLSKNFGPVARKSNVVCPVDCDLSLPSYGSAGRRERSGASSLPTVCCSDKYASASFFANSENPTEKQNLPSVLLCWFPVASLARWRCWGVAARRCLFYSAQTGSVPVQKKNPPQAS